MATEAEVRTTWGLKLRKADDPGSLKQQGNGLPEPPEGTWALLTHFGLVAPEPEHKKSVSEPGRLRKGRPTAGTRSGGGRACWSEWNGVSAGLFRAVGESLAAPAWVPSAPSLCSRLGRGKATRERDCCCNSPRTGHRRLLFAHWYEARSCSAGPQGPDFHLLEFQHLLLLPALRPALSGLEGDPASPLCWGSCSALSPVSPQQGGQGAFPALLEGMAPSAA